MTLPPEPTPDIDKRDLKACLEAHGESAGRVSEIAALRNTLEIIRCLVMKAEAQLDCLEATGPIHDDLADTD